MLFCPSVADELAFGPRQLDLPDVDGRIATWARQLELGALLERPPFELSGGEKKRVALGALFAVGPRDLLLDEPTAGLDPAAAARLIDLLAGLEGVTIVASTHNLGVAEELGTRAILLAPDHPGVLYDGPTAALVHDRALLAESGLAHRHGDAAHARYHVHDVE
jgi:cobalt/nickel transport system ATP-binding protein